jgi:TetR/AcrR family transcriptional regulator, mexJK operon transcriptional repressor
MTDPDTFPATKLPEIPAAVSAPARAIGQSKRDAIIEAAAAEFLEQGYGAASMDAIAKRANVSKATIYSHFENKHMLFGAIMTTRCQGVIPLFDTDDLAGRSLHEVLNAVARRFLSFLTSPNAALPLYRVVVTEAPRAPELGRAFYENGPARAAGALATYLTQQVGKGALSLPDPRLAAEQFFGLVLGHAHLRLLLGLTDQAPSEAEIDRAVASAVSIFLHGASAARHRAE